jgi:iron complex outermembrane recepter protein
MGASRRVKRVLQRLISRRGAVMGRTLVSTLVVAGLLYATTARAQSQPPLSIEESVLVVTAPPSTRASFETQRDLSANDVAALRADTTDELLRRLPSTQVAVNSRGEAIAFVRNASERQVGVFYDGAAINVPWDNRLDLSLFPAALVGEVRLAAGPLAPHYGVNSLAAISLLASNGEDDSPSALAVEQGDAGLLNGSAVFGFNHAATDFTLGVSASHVDGEMLSGDARLPFSQDAALRTNTDRDLAAFFARASFTSGVHDVSITAFHVDAEKGIAPESDRASGARFWRYPALEHSLGVLNITTGLGDGAELSSAVWIQRFAQQIDAFETVSYSAIDARQIDEDLTLGIREMLTRQFGHATLVASFSVLDSTHEQRDINYVAGIPPATLPEPLNYAQRNWSMGGEFEYAFTQNFIAEVGIGYDRVEYVETGDKPSIDDAEGLSGRVGLIWAPTEEWRLRAAIGRKIRAPTMRELFGQALNRFLINPDLAPERMRYCRWQSSSR